MVTSATASVATANPHNAATTTSPAATEKSTVMPGKADTVKEANRCLSAIQHHFSSRPPATGIQSHDYRPTDVIVTTFPKSGTTLTQYMAYQIVALANGGPSFDPTGRDFPDLSVVAPWLDYIPAIGIPPCETSPRILKTHSPLTSFPWGPQTARHVVVVRDPAAYPASWLDFIFDALVPNSASLDAPVREAAFHLCVERDLLTPVPGSPVPGAGRWHDFMARSLLPLREEAFVIFYEDMVADPAAAVRAVAAFMKCELDDAAVQEVVRRCDRSAMAGDTRFYCKIENKCFGVPSDVPKAKKARSDGFKRFRLSADEVAKLEDMNEKTFGVRTYAEFREMIKAKQRNQFNR